MKRFSIPVNMFNHKDQCVEFWALWPFSLRPFKGISGEWSMNTPGRNYNNRDETGCEILKDISEKLPGSIDSRKLR